MVASAFGAFAWIENVPIWRGSCSWQEASVRKQVGVLRENGRSGDLAGKDTRSPRHSWLGRCRASVRSARRPRRWPAGLTRWIRRIGLHGATLASHRIDQRVGRDSCIQAASARGYALSGAPVERYLAPRRRSTAGSPTGRRNNPTGAN